MRVCLLLAATLVAAMLVLPRPGAGQTPTDVPTCADFDAWVWAQSVYAADPLATGATLDPDADTIACPDLPLGGFAPALWTDAIPAAAEPAVVVGVTAGDTLVVSVDGTRVTVHLAQLTAPATFNLAGVPQCGGAEATTALSFVLGFAPDRTVYLEHAMPGRNADGDLNAYVWYALGGEVYLVNEVLVRTGWAELDPAAADPTYRAPLVAAAQFSRATVLGVWLRCGGFGLPPEATPTAEQVARARRAQPDQGQFDEVVAGTPPG